MKQLAEASRMRLKNWDIGDAQIVKSAAGRQNITFRAPVSGIVLEKNAMQGMRFMPGEVLYRIADLATVWVIAEVAEQDIGAVTQGSMAQVSVEAFPEKDFAGKIAFIYPTMDTVTRTVRVRLEVANPKGLLKPAMFASVKIQSGREQEVLTVPASAVIDSGTRQIVLVQLGQGNFEPRNVRTGRRGDQYVEILEGIAAGEQVVTSANFLIDSESNLKAALGGMGDAPAKPQVTKTVGHRALGVLEAVNDDGTASISHDPIPALKWPSMTMDFALANPSLVAGIKPGSTISFEIVERGKGEWIVTKLEAKESSHAEHDH
jgi:Cu(I)/Ag(I) efflux system membrane fusion protein